MFPLALLSETKTNWTLKIIKAISLDLRVCEIFTKYLPYLLKSEFKKKEEKKNEMADKCLSILVY